MQTLSRSRLPLLLRPRLSFPPLPTLITLLIPLLFSLGATQVQIAPDFSAKNQNEKIIHLHDLKGKFVLLFFYPKDDTPGCTEEACNFRDQYSNLKNLNTVVLGISRQDVTSHSAFQKKHRLPFDLLVDTKGDIAQLFGVGQMPLIGLTRRKSVLINPAGKIIRFYETVDTKNHANEVINDIKKAMQPQEAAVQ